MARRSRHLSLLCAAVAVLFVIGADARHATGEHSSPGLPDSLSPVGRLNSPTAEPSFTQYPSRLYTANISNQTNCMQIHSQAILFQASHDTVCSRIPPLVIPSHI
jgi:hypothetical protein